MRVLQIVPSISVVYGGPSQMVLGLSRSLVKEGIDVTILTTNSNGDAGQAPLDVPLGKLLSHVEGYQIIYFPCRPFRRYKFSFSLLQWLAKNAKQYDLAHIHALFSPVSTFAAKVAHQQRLPYILRPLGTLDPADLQKKKRLKQVYGYLLERPNIAKASAIHFTSTEECRISERYGVKTKDIVVPLGTEIHETLPPIGQTRTKLGIPLNTPLIVFLSRIDPKKGLDLLIPALETLQAKLIDFHFVLAGSNPQDPIYEAKIRQQIATSPLSNRTTITGFIAGENKRSLLQDADLFVLPSYYENFGIAVVEAMAIGTPVVISDQVHIWKEVQEYQAGWITATNQESLTENLLLVLQNSENQQVKGRNARLLVTEKYTWPTITQEMIECYQTILRANCHQIDPIKPVLFKD